MPTLNVLSICGSLRKGSYNAIVQRALPSLAPEGMTIERLRQSAQRAFAPSTCGCYKAPIQARE